MNSLIPWILAAYSLLLFIYARQTCGVLHPATLWTAVWGGATVLYALQLLPYHPLRLLTVVIVVFCSAAFVFGARYGDRFGIGPSRRAGVEDLVR